MPGRRWFPVRVVLYQIALEEKNARLLFQDLQSIKAASGSRVPAEAYEAVYHGEVDAKTLEDIFCIFNMAHPKGYCGRSLSVSDVVEVFDPLGNSDFFFCEPAGFARIEFDKSRTRRM